MSGEDKSLDRLSRTESIVSFAVILFFLLEAPIGGALWPHGRLVLHALRHIIYHLPSLTNIFRPTLHTYTNNSTQYKLGKHRSNGLELIRKVPPIEVEGDMAVCDGGGGALGHPLEYIKVGSRGGEPANCIYCGLRYVQKAH